MYLFNDDCPRHSGVTALRAVDEVLTERCGPWQGHFIVTFPIYLYIVLEAKLLHMSSFPVVVGTREDAGLSGPD